MEGSREYLFIGGEWDGQRRLLSNRHKYVAVHARTDSPDGIDVYIKTELNEADGTSHIVWVKNKISDTFIGRLLDNYRPVSEQ